MNFAVSTLNLLPPELAHNIAIFCLKSGLVRNLTTNYSDPSLNTDAFGLKFKNPLGIAAGFDKNAECYNSLAGFGFGFLELGAVTPKPQYGNKKPRIFRLKKDRAIINRLGFNNKGLNYFKKNIAKISDQGKKIPFGVNIGKNRETKDPLLDYALVVSEVSGICDYIALNVSSPNTPRLRELQNASVLSDLLNSVKSANYALTPVLIKISPDLTDKCKSDIINLALKNDVSGIIISNTTSANRNGLYSRNKIEYGGLSGRPLFELSNSILHQMYKESKGKMTFIGSGGIEDAKSAYKKIRNGASLLQLYSALVYNGFGLVNSINSGLADLLKADGFSNIKEAVGVDVNV